MILKSLQQHIYFSMTRQIIHSSNCPSADTASWYYWYTKWFSSLQHHIILTKNTAHHTKQAAAPHHPPFLKKWDTWHLLFMSFPDKSFSAEEGLFLFDTVSLEDSCWSAGTERVPVSDFLRQRTLALSLSWPKSAWFWLLLVLSFLVEATGLVLSRWTVLESSSLSSSNPVGEDNATSCCLEGDTGSANELCLTVFRLCALIRDHVVEWKLSASNQNLTKCSILRSSINWIK